MEAELIEMLVASNSIVDTPDVLKDFRLGLYPCLVNPLFDLFTLQAAEERFSHRVIPTAPRAAHAGTQAVGFAPTIEFVTAKLTVLIRMDDHRILRLRNCWP